MMLRPRAPRLLGVALGLSLCAPGLGGCGGDAADAPTAADPAAPAPGGVDDGIPADDPLAERPR